MASTVAGCAHTVPGGNVFLTSIKSKTSSSHQYADVSVSAPPSEPTEAIT
jgi:hypothetical protein